MEGKAQYTNKCHVTFDSRSENEGFARVVAASFLTAADPTMEELSDVKTAVSEAVTNCIIHGYENNEEKTITMDMEFTFFAKRKGIMEITIKDSGVGISDVDKAMEPLYTSKPESERSGMGFSFMEAFMDELKVESVPLKGTTVYMKKFIGFESDTSDTATE